MATMAGSPLRSSLLALLSLLAAGEGMRLEEKGRTGTDHVHFVVCACDFQKIC